MNELAKLLKKLRGKTSLRDITKIANVSPTYLNNLERGFDPRTNKPLNPSVEILKRLAKTYNYPYEELMKVAGYLTEIEIPIANHWNALEPIFNSILKSYINDINMHPEKYLDVLKLYEDDLDIDKIKQKYKNLTTSDFSSEVKIKIISSLLSLKETENGVSGMRFNKPYDFDKSDFIGKKFVMTKEGLKKVEEPQNNSPVISLPIVGTVAAGTPILAEENIEGYMDFPSGPAKGATFALKVRGESMINIGIHDGDYVIVKQQPEAETGQTVIARLEGAITIKRFYKLDDKIRLEPANGSYKPIESKDIEIVGIVLGVYRNIF